MNTAQDQQSRAEFGGCNACGAPAKFQAVYRGREFCQSCGASSVGTVAEIEAFLAVPAGMEPVGWVDKRSIDWLADLGRGPNSYTQTQIHKTREGVEDGQAIFTAAQVQAMGRVPPGFVAVPVEPTSKQVVMMAGAILQQGRGTADTRHPYWLSAVKQAEDAYRAMIDAAPRPPAAHGIANTKGEVELMKCSIGLLDGPVVYREVAYTEAIDVGEGKTLPGLKIPVLKDGEGFHHFMNGVCVITKGE